jgi:hypothetical protein
MLIEGIDIPQSKSPPPRLSSPLLAAANFDIAVVPHFL